MKVVICEALPAEVLTDCMLLVRSGHWYHHRLQTLFIVIKSGLFTGTYVKEEDK